MLPSVIFTPGRIPQYTYNPRSEFRLEEKVKEYLRAGGSILVVTGTTKSGKSVLIDRVIGKSGVNIAGGHVQKIGDFWDLINYKLNLPTVRTVQNEDSTVETIEGLNEASINLGLAKFGGGLKGSSSTHAGSTITQTRPSSPQNQAIDGLIQSKKVLVVDDFHYIRPNIQKNIIRSLRDPLLRELRVIFIAVPHKAYDVVRGEREMTGRVKSLKIPPWTESELKEIADSGFPLLNMHVSIDVLQNFASECFQSPNLMQEFCLSYCNEWHVENTLDKMTDYPMASPSQLRDFYKRIILQSVDSDEFERLATGPKEHGRARKKYTLKNGSQLDLYKGLLLAISKTGPKNLIKLNELKGSVLL